MAIQSDELFGAATLQPKILRFHPINDGVRSGKFAAIVGAPELARGTPLSYDSGSQSWVVWSAAVAAGTNEVQTFDLSGDPPTGGTFTLSFDGQTTGNIAFNATAAAIETAFEALSTVGSGNGTISGGDADDAPVVITFTGTLAAKNVPQVTLDTALLTGGSGFPAVATVSTPGSPSSGVGRIAGFVWPDSVQTHATNQVIGQMFRRGLLHRDDVVLPSGENQADLDEALREGPRELGMDVQGLSGVH